MTVLDERFTRWFAGPGQSCPGSGGRRRAGRPLALGLRS